MLYIHNFTGTASWAALAPERLGFKGSLTASSTNAGNLEIRLGDDAATESTLSPGEYMTVAGEDISRIKIKGNGYVLKAFGSTREGWH